MSLKQSLQKQKNAGDIDFIEVPIDWGCAHKEFILFDHKLKTFSRIFYDNKYRQNTFKPDMQQITNELQELSTGLDDIGLYNTRDEYNKKQKEFNFYYHYLTTPETLADTE